MSNAGIKISGKTILTEEYKRRVIRRALAFLKDGYSKLKVEKLIKHDMNNVEVWAAEYGVAWPEKHKRKRKESLT